MGDSGKRSPSGPDRNTCAEHCPSSTEHGVMVAGYRLRPRTTSPPRSGLSVSRLISGPR